MKNKKGFTLVELLAVIAILALLMIVAVPNIINMYKESKKSTFTTEVKNVYKIAQQQWVTDSLYDGKERVYSKTSDNNCTNSLELSGRNEFNYYIKIDEDGNVVEYYATDGTYQYKFKHGELKIEDINEVSEINELNDDTIINVSCNEVKTRKGNLVEITEFDQGYKVNTAFKILAGAVNPRFTTEDTEIIAIKRATSMPTDGTTTKKISSQTSYYPVYAWYKDNTIYYYSEDNYIYLNSNASNTFNGFTNLETLDLKYINTSNVTNMEAIFQNCSSLTSIDLSKFNTSKVTNMKNMFDGCVSLTSLDLRYLDTSNVTNMWGIFSRLHALTRIDLSRLNTSKVTTMAHMFYDDKNLTYIDVSNLDTRNVTNMSMMFEGCESVPSLDVSSFDTSKVTQMNAMFDHGFQLVRIYASDKWSTQSVTYSDHMFRYCPKLKGSSGSTTSYGTNATFARFDNPPDNPGYFTYKLSN